jgi:hypothetical protein
MNAQDLTQFYMDFLKEEGYVPKIDDDDDDGDITFKFEGDRYFIPVDEKDLKYFRMYAVWKWECKDDGERTKLFKAASDTNLELKLVKTSIGGEYGKETVITIIETLLNNEEDFKVNLSRWLAALKEAIDTFGELLEKEDGEEEKQEKSG